MAKFGSFGNLIFEVSYNKILTFDKWQRTTKHRYQKHDIINYTPKLESLGKELQEISFEIYFNFAFNVNPREEMQKLRQMCDRAEVNYLVVGGEIVGDCLWVIEEISESVETFGGAGQVLSSRATVKLKEYEPVGDF